MTSAAEHRDAVVRAVSTEPALADDHPTVVGHLQRLCRAAKRDLPADGVGVSVLSRAGNMLTAASSDPASAVLEELQFTLGEGPCMSAFSANLPVLVPDLEGADVRWSAYAAAAMDHGVRGVFAFPLLAGKSGLGALDVYRVQPGRLSSWAVARAVTYADVAMQSVLDAQEDTDELADLLTDSSDAQVEVYQAQGMVMIQLGLSPDDALLRIRAHAFMDGRRIVDVAIDIINRRLVLEADPPHHPDGSA